MAKRFWNHAAFEQNYVNDLKREDASRYKGAFVFEPVAGLVNTLAILDFASLYPSIIIGYNLCYTTLQDGKDVILDDNRSVSYSRE